MRTTKIVSVAMPPAMFSQAEKFAKKENRTKSELFREAFRHYILNQEWQELNAIGRAQAKKLSLKPSDVNRLIKEFRTEQRAKVAKRN